MRALAILTALAAAATPAFAQSTETKTTTTSSTPSTTSNGSSTTVTSPSGASTTISSPGDGSTAVTAPAGSSTTVTAPDGTATTVQTQGSVTTSSAPAATTVPVTALPAGSGGDDVTVRHDVYTTTSGPKTSGVELSLLGGGIGYRSTLQGGTNAGPSYGVALGFRAGGPVGVELSYQGATYTPSGTDDLTGGARRIYENGGQALLKLGGQAGPFDLYVMGGGAVSRFTVNGGATGSNINGGTIIRDGTVYKVPAGVGLDFHIPVGGPDLLIGARGQYNFLFNQSDVFTGVSNSDRDADQIQAQVNVGMLF